MPRPASFLPTALITALVLGACGEDDIEGDPLANAHLDATSKLLSISMGNDGCGVAIPELGGAFLAALPDCGDKNAGKCVPPSPVMAANVSEMLAKCNDTGTCVPKMFLQANKTPLKSCKSFGKADGVCVSRIIPTIDKLTFLPSDGCEEGERCAPCANPTDGKVTGICDIGKPPKKPADQCKVTPASVTCPYVGKPVLDVTKLTPCASAGMHCLPKAVVPTNMAALLAPCTDPTFLCAPDKSIEANGQYIPKTCKSIGGSEGRCLHETIPQVAAQGKFLPKEGCESYERCAPCFDPLSGDPLPSCSVACDPGPKGKALVFSKCGDDLGRCVPLSAVPPDMQKNLKLDVCKDGEELCAPVLAIDRKAKPQMCALKILGIPRDGKPAVCVEDVLKIGIALSQSNCPEGFKCTPCQNPLEGDAPTGLPGCPK